MLLEFGKSWRPGGVKKGVVSSEKKGNRALGTRAGNG